METAFSINGFASAPKASLPTFERVAVMCSFMSVKTDSTAAVIFLPPSLFHALNISPNAANKSPAVLAISVRILNNPAMLLLSDSPRFWRKMSRPPSRFSAIGAPMLPTEPVILPRFLMTESEKSREAFRTSLLANIPASDCLAASA